MKSLSKLLEAVADPNRLRIILCLQVRPACVCELVQAMEVPQPRISRHLRTLREAGLVSDARDAQFVEYSLVDAAAGTPEAELLEYVARWMADDAVVAADQERLAAASRDQCVLS